MFDGAIETTLVGSKKNMQGVHNSLVQQKASFT